MRYSKPKLVVFLLSLMSSIIMLGQIKEPVHITKSIQKRNDETYEVSVQVKLDANWHIYTLEEQEFGIPSSFTILNTAAEVQKIGKLQISGREKVLENELGKLRVFENQVVFKQKVKILTQNVTEIKVQFEYQPCDDANCLAPNKQLFKFPITPEIVKKDTEKIAANDSAKVENKAVALSKRDSSPIVEKSVGLKMVSIDKEHPLSACTTVANASQDLINIFGLGFLGGLVAILMPCVFPLIPLTVSFFTKSKNRKKGIINAFWYGFFIVLIYVLLSVPFHVFNGLSANILNQVSTNFWLNLAFAIVFIVFAISFFGFFEITLPSSWANKADESSNRAGIFGSFFMALTLAIVSFSCTGPILGLLLVGAISATDGAMQLTVAMTGFGLALALPFTLFALFPSMLKSLPKSGGWMTTLKVIIGFIELALAMKFLSKADLVGLQGSLGFLKKELFIIIWLLILGIMVLYLFKLIRFPHDDKTNKKVSWQRGLLAALTIIFMGYLSTGLQQDSNLQLLSGLVPPSNYSWYKNDISAMTGREDKNGIGLYVNDLEAALILAKKENKPVLVDFTGYACENCRRMEDNVWADPTVHALLKNECIIVSLYMDSSEQLPKDEQVEVFVPVSGGQFQTKILQTQGDKWATFQAINFKNNSQPNYAMLSPEGKLLNADIAGYTDVKTFENFLHCGISANKNR